MRFSLVFVILFVLGLTYEAHAQTAPAASPTVDYTKQIPMVMDAASGVVVTPLRTSAAQPISVFGDGVGNDLAEGDRKKTTQQNIVITNLSDTYLCIKATTAVALCSALAMTCNAAATTNGQPIPPNTQRPFRMNGEEKACVLAAAATTGKTFIGERTVRKPL